MQVLRVLIALVITISVGVLWHWYDALSFELFVRAVAGALIVLAGLLSVVGVWAWALSQQQD